ncbi:hypothetical protein DDR33_07230 [Pararcticibacter amylolyticus]|uniref:Lipoprotein n=1 Tax=Pararcticibacter amylolyticus TaxID=2173175 RepID=A0A2U2PIE2_9SPHI|nr:hypothetical protein DDR33_07230 [Pararcticibacter amylolyticus]
MKKICFIMTLIGVLLSAGGCKVKRPGKASLSERRKWLKEYALCRCFWMIAKQDTAIQNDISQAIYVELTDYSSTDKSNIYNAIDSLASIAVNSIEPTHIADYEGKKPYMKSCIEFSKSKALDSLIRRYESRYSIWTKWTRSERVQ